jgi:hypothetical protein
MDHKKKKKHKYFGQREAFVQDRKDSVFLEGQGSCGTISKSEKDRIDQITNVPLA